MTLITQAGGAIMSTGDESSTGAGQSKPKAKVSPARNIIGVVLLIGFSCAAILEVVANRGYDAAVKKVEARMPKDSMDPNDKNSVLPTQKEAEKLIGKGPDGPLVKDGHEQKAVYSWQGLRRKYVLKAYYTNEKEPSLIRIETE
jgi:hypothetical protein